MLVGTPFHTLLPEFDSIPSCIDNRPVRTSYHITKISLWFLVPRTIFSPVRNFDRSLHNHWSIDRIPRGIHSQQLRIEAPPINGSKSRKKTSRRMKKIENDLHNSSVHISLQAGIRVSCKWQWAASFPLENWMNPYSWCKQAPTQFIRHLIGSWKKKKN